MKNYSIRELILVAILVGFLIVAIFSFFSFTFITNFFDTKLPIATSTPKGLLDLKPSKELYKPLDFGAPANRRTGNRGRRIKSYG